MLGVLRYPNAKTSPRCPVAVRSKPRSPLLVVTSCSVWSWLRWRRWWQWEIRHVVDSELLPRARKLFHWLPCSMIFDIQSNLLGSLLLKRIHTIKMSVQKVNKGLHRSCSVEYLRELTKIALEFEQQKSRKAVTSCQFVTGYLCISFFFSSLQWMLYLFCVRN